MMKLRILILAFIMTTIPSSISLIEHLLAVPKTSDENADEFEANRLDIQPYTIDLDDFSISCIID